MMGTKTATVLLASLWLLPHCFVVYNTCEASPLSRPYIPYRTSAFDQDNHVDHKIDWHPDAHRSQIKQYNTASPTLCPLQFTLGMSKRPHSGVGPAFAIRHAPVLHPIYPAQLLQGGGKQVVYTTQYEHLDVLSAALLPTAGAGGSSSSSSHIKEVLVQSADFPLLLESSSFHMSPIIHDVNADGIMDAVIADYDGAIFVLGLATSSVTDGSNKRYFHHAQVPRLYLRKDWMQSAVLEQIHGGKPPESDEPDDESSNTTTTTKSSKYKPYDPFHSFFEYSYRTENDKRGEDILRGVSVNVMEQDQEDTKALQSRRSRRVKHERAEQEQQETNKDPDEYESYKTEPSRMQHRRLQEMMDQREELPEQGQEENVIQEVVLDQADGNAMQDVENPVQIDSAQKEESNAQEATVKNAQGAADVDEKRNVQEMESQNENEQGEGENANNGASSTETNSDGQKARENNDADSQDSNAVSAEEADAQTADTVDQNTNSRTTEINENTNSQPGDTDQVGGENTEMETAGNVKSADTKSDFHHNAFRQAMKPHEEVHFTLDADKMEDDIIRTEEDVPPYTDDPYNEGRGDDYAMDDPDYARGYDDYYGRGGAMDDYYGYDEKHEEYYDSKNYMRVPPHILCDPVLVEIPKKYGGAHEYDDYLVVAVSYYFDEDEYQGFFSYKRFDETDLGDETEMKRGGYVASALMTYQLSDTPRWNGQVHLDMSSDFTAPENITIVGELPMNDDNEKMGAFALSPPTVADLDGDGDYEILIGTSLGFVYLLDARNAYKKGKWPIQMRRPVETRILVEDVTGDTNLEVFVADIGGNVVCFTHEANMIWHRNMLESLSMRNAEIDASSPMTLGDVDGDGSLDVVTTVQIGERAFVFAFDAASGNDLPRFPIELEKTASQPSSTELHQKLAQPLLVNLHADQSDLLPYIRRNGTRWDRPRAAAFKTPPHGGSARGLHIVQPVGDKLYIIEGGSGCTQPVSIGDKVVSTVQADDVHGTGGMDLVVATEEGRIVTLESSSPWHPLNTWNHGEMRGRQNAFAHGYSASQGIYVHDASRQNNEVFGIYVQLTFEIFDNRPNIRQEPDKRKYLVEVRDGTSSKRVVFRQQYSETGVYSEKVYIRYGPGWYSLSVVLLTTHGLMYEDSSFTVRYNVNFMNGFDILLWLPLVLASVAILLCGAKKANWDDEEFDGGRDGQGLGILGRALPS